MRSLACWNASCGLPWCRFRMNEYTSVEHEHRDDLAPPVDAVAVAQRASTREAPVERDVCGRGRLVLVDDAHVWCGHGRGGVDRVVDRWWPCRLPTANAGAPSRLTSNVMPYQSSPTPIALPVGTPSGWSRSTSRPSRMPRPDERDREHLGHRDRGEEGQHRAVRARRRRARGWRSTPATSTESW